VSITACSAANSSAVCMLGGSALTGTDAGVKRDKFSRGSALCAMSTIRAQDSISKAPLQDDANRKWPIVGPFSDRLLVHRDQFAAEFGARRILVKYRSR
jgi:hypothetical protein